MKGKGEFYQESVKGYLLAFLMEIARLDGETAGSLVSDKDFRSSGKISGKKRSGRWRRLCDMWKSATESLFMQEIWLLSVA